jgi:hypothetical protein
MFSVLADCCDGVGIFSLQYKKTTQPQVSDFVVYFDQFCNSFKDGLQLTIHEDIRGQIH